MAKKAAKVQTDTDEDLQAIADEKAVKPKKREAQIFTYVGGGEDSPRSINFMGLQHFTRGKATEVTDTDVLAKIINNPTFVQGEIDPDELDTYDATAKQEADKKRQHEKTINAAYSKKHRTE